MSDREITVSVAMITYGHANFIKEAINGVLIQECKFNIELIIADDNSPDHTEEVVTNFLKDHPRKHWVRYTKHKENKNMFENARWSLNQARGKYIAICEGDDYWSDPHKLQKQVAFLENNPDYGLVYTKSKIFEEKTQRFFKSGFGSPITNKGLLYISPIPTLTTLMRNDLFKLYLEEEEEMRYAWKMGDYPIWIWMYYNSKIHFINETTTVYRKLENSASNFEDGKKQMIFRNNIMKVQTYYGKKYLNNDEFIKLKNHILYNYYYMALIFNPTDTLIYYNEIKETEELNTFTKTKLFVLEKLRFKQLYLIWFKIKRILKSPFAGSGEN